MSYLLASCKVTLLETLRSNTQGRGYMLQIVDSSGSIGGSVFQSQVIPAATKIFEHVQRFDISYGLISFSAAARMELTSGFTTSFAEAKRAVSNIPYQGGNTDLAAALSMAGQLISQPSRTTIIVLTDGRPDAFPEKELKELKGKGVMIFVIGFNSIDVETAQKIASSPSLVFVERTLEQLLRELEFKKNEIEGTIYAEPTNLKNPLTLQLKIQNIGWQNIPKGSTIKFFSNDEVNKYLLRDEMVFFLEKDIPHGKSADISIQLTPRPNIHSFLELPCSISYVIELPNSLRLQNSASMIVIPSDIYSDEFREFDVMCGNQLISLIMFGPAGSGKGSTLNAIVRAISEKSKMDSGKHAYVMVGNGNKHNTVKLELIPLREFNVEIIDTFGIDESWNDILTQAAVRGYLPPNFHKDSSISLEKLLGNTPRNIDSVLLVVAAQESNQKYIASLHNIVKECHQNDIVPVLVLTHLPESYEARQNARNDWSKEFGLTHENVFELDYEGGNRTCRIDFTAAAILQRAMRNGNARRYKRFETCPKIPTTVDNDISSVVLLWSLICAVFLFFCCRRNPL